MSQIYLQNGCGLSFADSLLPSYLTLDDGHSETNLTLMGVTAGHTLQPVSMDNGMDTEDGDKSPQPVLTQLSNSDYKFGNIDFRAEFISQPISEFNLSSLEDSALSVNLPSFSDTYTKSVITTIEPRVFGAEAEYENRMRERRESKHHILQIKNEISNYCHEDLEQLRPNSVIISSMKSNCRDRSPSPLLLPILHSSIENFLHSQESRVSETSDSSFNQDLSDPVSSSLFNSSSFSHLTQSSSDLSEFSSSFSPGVSGHSIILSCSKIDSEHSDTTKLSSSPVSDAPTSPVQCSVHIPTGKRTAVNTKQVLGACLLCAVCGDNAACQHYGVRTCEGCKGFFKRTVQKSAKYVCLADKNCPVDKRRRNRCQFCRFQKCLTVGMVKEVVRTDGLKGRRGRLPTKPRTQLEQSSAPPVTMITALVRAHMESTPKLENLDYSQYIEMTDEDLDSKAGLISSEAARISQFYSILTSSIDVIYKFCDRIPGYNELQKPDRELLFRSSCLQLFTLRLAHRSLPDSQKFTFCNGVVLHRNQVKTTLGDWLDGITELSKSLQQIDIDASAYACLAALILVNGNSDREGLAEGVKVEQLNERILAALRDHVTYNPEAQKKPQYLTRVLEKLPFLRNLSQQAMQRIFYLRLVGLVPEPPILEKLFSSNIPF